MRLKVRFDTMLNLSGPYVNKFKKSNSLPKYMRLNDRSASSKRSICDLKADHFKSVFRTDTLEPVQRIESFNQLIAIQIDFGELILSLRKLDDNVKSGPDQIPPFLLRRCIPSLAKPILQIFNKPLATGIFPSSWKNSYIYPI